MGRQQRWVDTDKGKPKHSEKAYPPANLSTANHTLTDVGLNPSPRGHRLPANSLDHGTAPSSVVVISYNKFHNHTGLFQ